MSRKSKSEYIAEKRRAYDKARKPKRSRILDEVCETLGHNITTVNQTAYDLGEGEMHLRRGRQVSLRVKRGTLRSESLKMPRKCDASKGKFSDSTIGNLDLK